MAHALADAGHQAILLERSPQLKPVGAGISIQPNALQALKRLNLDNLVSNAGWQAKCARVISNSGKQYSKFDFTNYRELFGFLPHTIYRGDLMRVLHEALDKAKTTVLLSQSLESFRETENEVVVTTNSQSIECDALIGADGIHSSVREQLWGKIDPIYAGYTCWRGMVTDPTLVNLVDTMTEVWGKGARFGFMRCNAKQVYWFATENRPAGSDHEPRTENWKSRFDSWVDPVPQLLRSTAAEEIVHNDIIDHAPIFPWGKGRVTLIGDAAHAMTPNFGQGGAQAIEDAVVLGVALKQVGEFAVVEPTSVESAFRSYEAFRRPRTTKLVKGSRQFGKIGQGGNGFLRLIRNQLMPRLPKGFVDKQLGWQCNFDAHLNKFGATAL